MPYEGIPCKIKARMPGAKVPQRQQRSPENVFFSHLKFFCGAWFCLA